VPTAPEHQAEIDSTAVGELSVLVDGERTSGNPIAVPSGKKLAFQVSFTFDEETDEWDDVAILFLHEPNSNHADGIAFTSPIGQRHIQSRRHSKGKREWTNLPSGDESTAALVSTPRRQGEYEIRIVLRRIPKTVADTIKADETPEEFQTPIWHATMTVE
jgi:hypothetical protein